MEQILIYFIYLFIYLIFTNFAKRPGTRQIYYKYTTSYSIHPDEEQLGLRVILPMSNCQNMVQTKPGLDRIYPTRG